MTTQGQVMRARLGFVALGLFGVSAAFAEPAPPPQSPADYVKAIEASKGPDVAPASDACAPGLVETEEGDCGKPVNKRGADLAGGVDFRAGAGVRRVATAGPRRVAYTPPPRTSLLGSLPITFRLGSAEIESSSRQQAEFLAAALKSPEERTTRFLIAGHTDASGSAARNLVLSQARADSVKDFLIAQGVEASRLEARGYGSREPARPEQPFDPANRRVEARPIP